MTFCCLSRRSYTCFYRRKPLFQNWLARLGEHYCRSLSPLGYRKLGRVGFALLGRSGEINFATSRRASTLGISRFSSHKLTEGYPVLARPPRMSRCAAGLCVISLGGLFLVSGCAESHPYAIVPITGFVKYADGSLISAERIALTFTSDQPPLDSKTHPRPGIGDVNIEDGSVIVSTYEFDDGLIRGKHKVTVMSVDARGLPTKDVPSRYHKSDTSGLTVDTENLPFELLIEKP